MNRTDVIKKNLEELFKLMPYSTVQIVTNLVVIILAKHLDLDLREIADSPRAFKWVKEKIEEKLSQVNDEKTSIASAINILLQTQIAEEYFTKMVEFVLTSDLRFFDTIEIIDEIVDRIAQDPSLSQLSTPESINKLAVDLIQPTNGQFYDGVAGLASTIVNAYNFANKEGKFLEFYTQEIHSFAFALSVIRLYFCKISGRYGFGDTLTNPIYLDNEKLKKFDYSIMFSPVGLKLSNIDDLVNKDKLNRFFCVNVSKASADWLFAMHQVASLKEETGRAVIGMFSGSLFSKQSKEIREEFIKSGVIECIISFPPGMLLFTAIPFSLVVFNNAKRRESNILMIDAEKLVEKYKIIKFKGKVDISDDLIDEIVKIYKGKLEKREISKNIGSEEIENSILLPSRYVLKKSIETEEFGNVQIIVDKPENKNEIEWVKLIDAGTVFRGINATTSILKSNDGDYKIINYSDIKSGHLDLSSMERCWLRDRRRVDKFRVKEGDIIISCKGEAIKICKIPEGLNNVLLSLNFIGVRINTDLFNSDYLLQYLKSPVGMYYIKSKQMGSSIRAINMEDLSEIPVPRISLKMQSSAVKLFNDKEKEIDKKIKELYDEKRKIKLEYYSAIKISEMMILEKGWDENGN